MARPQNSATKLARLLDLTPDPVYVLDEGRTILFCNRACAEWTGLEPVELIGRRVDYYSSDQGATAPGIAAGLCPPPAAFAGQETIGHVSCMLSDGRLHYRRARFVPLGGTGADQVGVVAFVSGGDLSPFQLEKSFSGDSTGDALHQEIRRFRAAQAQRYAITQLIGRTPAMRQARAQVQVAAGSRSATVIVGERGNGRAHVARTIHYQAHKTEGRLIPIACGLLDTESLHSTLSGLVRETSDQPATVLFEQIDALAEQQQLLVAELLGSALRLPLLLGTANESLLAMADRGEFRRDLACLLSTLEIRLPALRDRVDDLPLLAQFFIEEENRSGGKQIGGLSGEALELFLSHHWPGNLDELAQVIQAAHRAAAEHQIASSDLPARMRFVAQAAQYPRQAPETIVLEEVLAKVELELIEQALERAKGNKTKAARLLGMNRPRFYRRLEQLGLAEQLIDSSEFELDEPPSEP